jgi:hypothetical protein
MKEKVTYMLLLQKPAGTLRRRWDDVIKTDVNIVDCENGR